MVLDWDQPAKTSDFGSDGYTGSVTDWHELLQLTAPDEQCGLVFARGKFPDDPEAILARAQNFNRKDTWGLQLLLDAEVKTRNDCDQSPNYRLGNAKAQGFINHRWPYMKFALEREGHYEGTCEICSFVKDGQVYQIHRFFPGEPLRKRSSVQSGRNEIGSKPEDAIISDLPQRAANSAVSASRGASPIKFRVGGEIRFGCSCTNGDETWHGDDYKVDHIDAGDGLSCSSERYQKSLDMRLFVNGSKHKIGNRLKPEPRSLHSYSSVGSHIREDRPEWNMQSAQMGVFNEVSLEYDNPTIIIVNFALRSLKSASREPDCLSGQEIREYLGSSESSTAASKRLWDSCKSKNDGSINFPDITAIARTVEVILSVYSVPVKQLQPLEDRTTSSVDKKRKSHPENPRMLLRRTTGSSDIGRSRPKITFALPVDPHPTETAKNTWAPSITQVLDNKDVPEIPLVEVVSPKLPNLPEVQKKPVKQSPRILLQENETGIAIVSNIIAPQHTEAQTTL